MRKGERGQVLVMAALMMPVLLGMLALVLDVGNAYAQRRFMQNAADAASLAGARYMALNRSTATDAGVRAALTPMLTSNGNGTLAAATGPDNGAWYINLAGGTVGPVGTGGVPSGAAGVRVNATKTFPTFFARLLGYENLTVKAVGEAIYGTAGRIYLDWTKTGVMVMPLAFDIDAYRNSFDPARCGASFGTEFHYSLYIDTPTDCALGTHDTHFSFTTLNIGNNCANSTTVTVLETLLNNPGALGNTYIEPGVTPIQVCHGARATTWDQIPSNRPFLVPVISHPAAVGCDPSCWTPVINFVYMEKRTMGGNGINTYLVGRWVDPRTQPPLRGTGVSTTSRSVEGPVSYSLSR
jgi:Flp pilus assembly protein TadG